MTTQPVQSGFVGPAALSPREIDAVREVASGDTYAVVAERLGIREQTIKNQMLSARKKLDVSSTIELYAKLGWLRVPA